MLSGDLEPFRALTSKKYENVYEKIVQKYECIDDVKMHCHAKFEDEKSFMQEEIKKKRQISLSIWEGCRRRVHPAQ